MNCKTEPNSFESNSILVEASASLIIANYREKGILTLTNKALKFQDIDGGDIKEFSYPIINSVAIYKLFGTFKRGIKINYNGQYVIIFVKYPEDWIKLIEKQRTILNCD